MRFLIDANLPAVLTAIFENLGHEAIHTSSLPDGNATQDGVIIEIVDDRTVIPKDSDFYQSFLIKGRRENNLRLLVALFRPIFRQKLFPSRLSRGCKEFFTKTGTKASDQKPVTYSHGVPKRIPKKLIFVKVGNMRGKALLSLFYREAGHLVDLLGQHDCIEVHPDKIVVID